MSLDLENNLFERLKGSQFVQSFIKELSNYLENNKTGNSKILDSDYKWNNLISDDLSLYNKKVITKYRDKMLIQRRNILQSYAENLKESGEMYYIYNTSSNEINSYNLCSCNTKKNHEVITKQVKELPKGTELGSVLIKQGEKFIMDAEATKAVGKQINMMIQEKIKEQSKYLDNKRIEGHIYEVGEKYSERIWLYDLENTSKEGIEEINFPKDLYETAKEGDLFVFKNGEYQLHA